MKRYWLLVICHLSTAYCLLHTSRSCGQTLQLTQFYAAPTFMNPAFAGVGVCARLSTNYRIQWPEIPGAFTTTVLSFDHHIPKKRSGMGLLFTNDKAGSGNLRSTGFYGQFSHQLLLFYGWSMSAALEAGYTIRDYDFNKLVFGDMLAFGTPTTVENPTALRVGYADISSGVLLFDRKTWMGFSAHHLNRPNQAVISPQSRLPVRYSVHLGTNIPVGSKAAAREAEPKESITPAVHYRAQAKFDQLDLGFYYTRLPLVTGIWYRGIPALKAYQPGYPNHDAVALIAGVAAERFKFAYSYDITISWLRGSTKGAHEISLSYRFCDEKKKKPFACPKF